MSTSILPDDSLLIRHGPLAIHFDKDARRIRVRAVVDYDETGGSLLYDYAMTDAARVRVEPEGEGRVSVVLEMKAARRFALGPPTTEDVATMTARVVADITRCIFEIPQGGQAELPGPSQRFSAATTMNEGGSELLPLLKLRERLLEPEQESSGEDPTDPPPEDYEDPFAEATEFDEPIDGPTVPPDELITGAESLPEIKRLQQELIAEQGSADDELDPRPMPGAEITDAEDELTAQEPARIVAASAASVEAIMQADDELDTGPSAPGPDPVLGEPLEPVKELPLVQREAPAASRPTIADADIPDGVFAALIKETGLAAAESPLEPQVLKLDESEGLQTLVGDGPNRQRGAAMLELLALASAHMPVASIELAAPGDD